MQLSAQSKIDRSKQEVNKGQSTPTTTSASNTSHGATSYQNSSSSANQTFGEIVSEAIFKSILFITYYSSIGNYSKERHLHNQLTRYPYDLSGSGNYTQPDSNYKNKFRIEANYQFLYEQKKLTGHHLKATLRPSRFFYFQTQYHWLQEDKSNMNTANLSLLNIHLCYDRLRFQRWNVGWKLGISYLGNGVKRAGLSAGLSGEAYLVKPISLLVSKQWSQINHVPVNQFEITGKLNIKRYQLHIGYERLKIGTPHYDFFTIGTGVVL